MRKYLRINYSRTTLEQVQKELGEYGFKFKAEQYLNDDSETLYLDEDFSDLIVIPSVYFADLKSKPIVEEGRLIFQDKASLYAPRYIASFLKDKSGEIIEARSGCGTRVSYLSLLLPKSKIHAFEGRPTRLESLRTHLERNNCTNAGIISHSFITSQPRDFPEVTTVIVEPPSSGTAVMDRLGFLLQEEEFPAQDLSQKDILSLQRTQISYLKHAFTFTNANHIIYVTRSVNKMENFDVVNYFLDRNGDKWELQCVMPEKLQDSNASENEECLFVRPSDDHGNGIFIAHFHRKGTDLEPEEETMIEEESGMALAAEEGFVFGTELEQKQLPKTKKKPKRTARKLALSKVYFK